ncbi:MAG: protein kinase domain-containing protein, partial [Gemmataceae bacterium]
ADFGLARVYESSNLSGLTLQGELGGTPAFMAPEQVTHYRDVRPAADQYSAAATLYFLLTGRYTFELPTDGTNLLVHILTASQVPVRERRPELPKSFALVLEKALAREVEDRFASVHDFRRALLPFGQ